MKIKKALNIVLACSLCFAGTAFAKKNGKKGKPHKEEKVYASYPWQNYCGAPRSAREAFCF